MGRLLLRVAAGQGLRVTGGEAGRPGWRVRCARCTGWLELPARPPGAVWWLRRVCAFATRHRHPLRGGAAA